LENEPAGLGEKVGKLGAHPFLTCLRQKGPSPEEKNVQPGKKGKNEAPSEGESSFLRKTGLRYDRGKAEHLEERRIADE